jgi:hypothetical protein
MSIVIDTRDLESGGTGLWARHFATWPEFVAYVASVERGEREEHCDWYWPMEYEVARAEWLFGLPEPS